MKIKDVVKFLETEVPPSLQESYDNAGLIVGNKDNTIENILISLDCTKGVVEEAVKKKCGLIIAHHPVIFEGLKKITGKNNVEKTVIQAIKNDIGIYAIHTNLDNIFLGVNFKICEKLGLKNCKILSPKKGILKKLFTFCPVDKANDVRQAIFAAGAGMIGRYDECSFNSEGTGTFRAGAGTNPYVGEKGKQHHEKEIKIEIIFPEYLQKEVVNALLTSHPYEEAAYDIITLDNIHPGAGCGMIGELTKAANAMTFLKKVKKVMKAGCIRYAGNSDKKVQKVALCGGSGSFMIKNAIEAKADVFITGDLKYHQFFDAEDKIILADIGHYESEQFTKELLYELLIKKFPTFAFHLSKTTTNPINYL